jgi:glutamate-5-semialdehyde dehydrogenase
MSNEHMNIREMGQAARAASKSLALASTAQKNSALDHVATGITDCQDEILDANSIDVETAMSAGVNEHIQDRLVLNSKRLSDITDAVHVIANLPDPVGELIDRSTGPSGLEIERRRVPLGVIGVIYESRPNITVDIGSLCLKAGNAVILRGGTEAFNSNAILARIVSNAADAAGLPKNIVQFVQDTNRDIVRNMLAMDDYIDLLIPRGSAALVKRVAEEATMPAVTGGVGVCHTYVDSTADIEMARKIVVNAKTQRPYVCNALDTILVHIDVAGEFLPTIANDFMAQGVELRCDRRALSIIGRNKYNKTVQAANDSDWGREFLGLIASVAIVESMDQAITHIAVHGSGHSEAIVTSDNLARERFLREVDASAVFANTSTRYNDGGEFGLGAELAISTDKMHARGPIGLREITSYKWVVRGNGQIRD